MYETDEKGTEVAIVIEDVNPEALFSESLLALSDLLSDATGGTPVTHEVELRAPDLQALLDDWVRELVKLGERDGFVPERVEKLRLESTSVRARVAGERSIPLDRIRPLTPQGVEVKRLDDGAWAARAILSG